MQNKFLIPSNWMWMTRLLISSFLLSAALLAQASDALLLSLRGDPAPGALMIGKVVPGASITLNGKSVGVNEQGDFVFGFGRDDSGSHALTISRGEVREQRTLELMSRHWNIQRVEGVPQRTVNPPEEVLARIRSEATLVRTARETDSARTDFLQSFVWPASGPITGVYGSQRYYNGEPKSPHYGLDIAGPNGAPVVAPAAGKVTLVHNDMFYSGGTLILDHGMGISSTFIHLSKIVVKQGDEVQQGQLIAHIGASGRATGPHLDWRLNWFGERLDPQWFMSAVGVESVQAGTR